jgi:phosphoribosylglycinamide formyltransferase-1
MRIGFCISGGGRAVEAILEARRARLLTLDGAVAFLDRSTPFEAVASSYDLPVTLLPRYGGEGKEDYRNRLGQAVADLPVDGLFLSFDWVLPKFVVEKFDPSIINLHMALLPLFPGRGSVSAALASGMTFAGATIHRVDEGMDTGPIIGQATTPIRHAMTEAHLGRAIFKAAVPLCIQAVRWLENGSLGIAREGRVFVEGAEYGGGNYSPRLDADIEEFSLAFLKQHYPD